MILNKQFAFTLSEAMIAVAIVGVIAALTIPNVVSNYQKKSYATTLQKVYVDLQQNLTVLETENYLKKGLSNSVFQRGYVGTGDSGKSIEETAGTFFKNYYKINQDCETNTQPCFAEKYGDLSSSSETDFDCSKGYSVLLPNGAAMCIVPPRGEEAPKTCYGTICLTVINKKWYPNATVYIDINGNEPPNIGGRDMFTFNIYEDFTIDEVSPDDVADNSSESKRTTLENGCTSSSVGAGCFTKLMNNNWKMNY